MKEQGKGKNIVQEKHRLNAINAHTKLVNIFLVYDRKTAIRVYF
jgi:hypothetical protein